MRWYFAFFVVSGFCSLVCEVVWLRLAMASFGVTTAMVSIVVSMFMAGLGFGSWGAGVLVRRGAAAPHVLRFYALAELLVGFSALLVPNELKLGRVLLQAMSSSAVWQSSRYYVLSGGWVALALIPWCTCMGSTFPLLIAVIRQMRDLEANRSFSYLYVANVFGALLGTGMSAFVLIELLGFRGTLDFAASLNFALGLTAFCISLTAPPVGSLEIAPLGPARDKPLYGLPRASSLWMLFTTGFVSMGLEVIWVRQFTPYLGNVVYAFAGILITYLLATFWGSQDYRSWAGSHNVEETAPSWTLLALFALIPLATADPLLPLRIGTLELGGWRMSAIVLFCALAGFLTPMLIDSWSVGNPGRAGTAYAINVLGSILGPLVAGFWLLPHIGERWASVALASPLFVVAALTALRKQPTEVPQRRGQLNPKMRYAVVSVTAILLVSLSHDYERKFPEREVRRDYTATVIATGTGFDKQLLVNGVGMTKLGTITKYMAHLPLAFMSRPPRNGLVICFGMGTTFRSMLSWGIPTTSVDLVPSIPALFGYFHSDAKQLLSSPLSKIVVDDGRRFLDGSNQSYDVIVVDPPPPPEATGSSLLYSREFDEVIKKHLPPDGIFQIWFPEQEAANIGTTASIAKALKQTFPYVRAFRSFDDSGIHFLASMEPLPSTSAGILASRVPHAAAADFREWTSGVTTEGLFSLVLAKERPIEMIIAQDPMTPALEDDQPINEYYKLRSWFHYYR
jgi:spermidine synthase